MSDTVITLNDDDALVGVHSPDGAVGIVLYGNVDRPDDVLFLFQGRDSLANLGLMVAQLLAETAEAPSEESAPGYDGCPLCGREG